MSTESFVLIQVTRDGVTEVSLGARNALEEVGSLQLYATIRENIRAIDGQVKRSIRPE
jgi:hypothetical protein